MVHCVDHFFHTEGLRWPDGHNPLQPAEHRNDLPREKAARTRRGTETCQPEHPVEEIAARNRGQRRIRVGRMNDDPDSTVWLDPDGVVGVHGAAEELV